MDKKTYILIAAVAIILIAGFVWWNSARVEQEPVMQESDTVETIQQDLDAIDIGDVDTEFKDVDETLKAL